MAKFPALLAALGALVASPVAAQDLVDSELIPIAPGEQALRQVLVVDASLERTWALFTSAEGVTAWMAPVAEVDLRTGGTIRTNYDPCMRVGDSGTITLNVVNFVPQRLLTLKSDLETQREARWMNEEIYERRDRLYNVIELEAVDEGHTRITSWGLGYGTSEAWNDITGFFIAGNEWSFGQLAKAIAGETLFTGCEADG